MIIKEMKRMRVGVLELAKAINISCYELGEMLIGEKEMPLHIKEKIKIFLTKNYTNCIDKFLWKEGEKNE